MGRQAPGTAAENRASDRTLIQHLRERGGDLTKSRHVGVHFDSPSEEIAGKLAATLRSEGWTTSITPIESEWLVSGTERWILVNEDTIADLRADMEHRA